VLTVFGDVGRPGWGQVGVGRAGAADARSLRLANRLVANDEGAAGLEVLLGGLRLRAVGDLTVALAGASGPAWLDDRPVGHDAVLELRSGAELRLGTVTAGLRTYVAVRGGLDVPAVLGSRSTDQLAALGPEPLRAGDVLPVGAAPAAWPVVDLAPVPAGPDRVELPVVPGPHADWFDDALAHLQTAEWRVTPATNRVAVRLSGPPLLRSPAAAGRELPSEGLVPGAVQVPPDGQPVVFGVDHPVTGGYPVVAVVRRAAHGRLGQVRPGDPLWFVRG
jgi:biotin-dependent carboxylase-like uncharacterized protein